MELKIDESESEDYSLYVQLELQRGNFEQIIFDEVTYLGIQLNDYERSRLIKALQNNEKILLGVCREL